MRRGKHIDYSRLTFAVAVATLVVSVLIGVANCVVGTMPEAVKLALWQPVLDSLQH